MNTQLCLHCRKKLTGRLDKKFCDADCRNHYHNSAKSPTEVLIRNVNRQLRKNRTILRTLCPSGKATVRRSVLDQLGFDQSIFSGVFSSRQGIYYFSYEYGYMPIKEFSYTENTHVDKALIIQKQDYMKAHFDPWKVQLSVTHSK